MIQVYFHKLADPGRFHQQVIITLITQIGALFISIANAAIIARYLGPHGKGTLALALLVPGMLGLLLSGGIGVANVYFAGSRRLEVPQLAANSVGFAILATVLGIGGVSAAAAAGWLQALVPGVPFWLLLLAMLGLPFGLLSGYFSTILQGLQRITTINATNFVQSAFTLTLTILLVIVFQMGLFGALLASLAPGAVTLILLGISLHRLGALFIPRWNRGVMRTTLSFGLKGQIGNILQFFNYRLDMFIINYFLEPREVGIYSVSVALAELLWYLPNAVGFVIFPKGAATRPEIMNTFTPRVFRVTLALTVMGALGLGLLGKFLIHFIFSSAFTAAYVPMVALLPGVVLLGGGKVLTNEIAGRGYPHYNSINAGLALMLTVMLDLILIPRYGIFGAALASGISYTAIFFTGIGFYLKVSRGCVSVALQP